MSRAVALLPVLFLLAVAAPAAAQEQRIALGVKAAGIDVGNLTVPEAAARLEQTAGVALARNVSVHVAGRRFRLTMKRAGFAFDAAGTAKRAYYAGRANPAADVPLAVRYRRAVVRDFADGVARAAHLAPRDATVRITVRKIYRNRSRTGRALDAAALRASIEQTLATPAAARKLLPKRTVLRAKVNANDLVRVYATIITIDRSSFKLRLFKRLKFFKTYGVAVGAAGYDTPAGRYRVQNKQVNPSWSAPNKPWAGLFAGTTVPGGSPLNPLRARWLGIANGVGIHGTGAAYSIGTRASHGCIRMRVPDVIDLYPRVPIGTPVLIS
jgi:lipoprotein-anchoring transpeptidase ErfK/SrfK